MADEKHRWVKVAEGVQEIAFGENGLVETAADDKRICLAKHQGELFAVAAKCPHASGIMANGFIDAMGNVVCPLHRYRFSLKNGRNVSGEGYQLKHWPVEVRTDGVYVGFEVKSFLGLF